MVVVDPCDLWTHLWRVVVEHSVLGNHDHGNHDLYTHEHFDPSTESERDCVCVGGGG